MAMVVLSTNNWGVIREQIDRISAALEAASPGSFAFVEIGHGRG